MIRILKWIFFNTSYYSLFSKLEKGKYRNIYDNVRIQLISLSLSRLWDLLKVFLFNKINLNSINIFETSNLPITPILSDCTVLYNTKSKKFFWSSFILSLLLFKSYTLFRKLLLWPFKLGVFSFLFSIIGLDVKWFLSLFDLFTINVPFWVYFQYLTLYNNWLNWFYNFVNIRNIYTVPVIEINKFKPKENISKELIQKGGESQPTGEKSNLKYYVVGLIILVGIFALVYFSDSLPSFGGNSGNGNIPSPPSPVLQEQDISKTSNWRALHDFVNRTSETSSTPLAQGTNNNSYQFNSPAYVEPSGSNSSVFVNSPITASTEIAGWPRESSPFPLTSFSPGEINSSPERLDPWGGLTRSASPTESIASANSGSSEATVNARVFNRTTPPLSRTPRKIDPARRRITKI